MISLRPYPGYKDSGVSWLGEIPKAWAVKRLRSVAQLAASNVDKIHGDNERLVRLCNYTDVYYRQVITNDIDFMPGTATNEEIKRFSLRFGDVMFTKDSESFDDIGIPAVAANGLDNVVLGYHLMLARPEPSLYGPFLAWYFTPQPNRWQFEVAAKGVTRFGMSLSGFKNALVPLPPLDEQRVIADFLDAMDDRITRFIAARRRMIVLLEEQKQAIINQAVTRGLDPDVPMKPSGIDWLGEIPAHWDVMPIGYFSRVGNGSTPSRGEPRYWADSGFPWLNSSVVNQDQVVGSDQFVTSDALLECHLPLVGAEDLLVGITGQGRTRGMVTILKVPATINQHIAYIRVRNERVNPDFLRLVLRAAYSNLREISSDAGSTKGALTCEDIKRYRVPIPPLAAQARVIEHCQNEERKSSRAATQCLREIQLVQEYRTRLFSDVVTGKLDVRGVELPRLADNFLQIVETAEDPESQADERPDDE